MRRASDKDLLFVSKLEKTQLDALKAGVSLESRTGYRIDELQGKAIMDRLQLARTLLSEAEKAATAHPPSFRTVVSRAYYSMYHSTRALCFFCHRGDDNEQHSKLPGAIPADFPDRSRWENDLKRARLDRNRADYDPYPRAGHRFAGPARDLLQSAKMLLAEVRSYLRAKGCRI